MPRSYEELGVLELYPLPLVEKIATDFGFTDLVLRDRLQDHIAGAAAAYYRVKEKNAPTLAEVRAALAKLEKPLSKAAALLDTLDDESLYQLEEKATEAAMELEGGWDEGRRSVQHFPQFHLNVFLASHKFCCSGWFFCQRFAIILVSDTGLPE